MKIALNLAQKACELDEVPVGALIVSNDGEILSQAHNLRESSLDPTGHAELLAIKKAAKAINSWRLIGAKLYVTLEPCMMCAGAIWQSRLSEVIYGASDPKHGFIHSIYTPFNEDTKLNHKPKITSGILQEDCGLILTNFFKEKRKNV